MCIKREGPSRQPDAVRVRDSLFGRLPNCPMGSPPLISSLVLCYLPHQATSISSGAGNTDQRHPRFTPGFHKRLQHCLIPASLRFSSILRVQTFQQRSCFISLPCLLHVDFIQHFGFFGNFASLPYYLLFNKLRFSHYSTHRSSSQQLGSGEFFSRFLAGGLFLKGRQTHPLHTALLRSRDLIPD